MLLLDAFHATRLLNMSCVSNSTLSSALLRRALPRVRGRDLSTGIEHDQMIGKLVLVVVSWRKLFGQEFSTRSDGIAESFFTRPAAQMIGEVAHDLLPSFHRNLFVDFIVRDHLGEALGERHVDKDARAALGGVQVLHQEMLDGPLVCPRPFYEFRHES